MDIEVKQKDVWEDKRLACYTKHDPLRYTEVSFSALCEALFKESRNPDTVQKFLFYLARVCRMTINSQNRIAQLTQFFLEMEPISPAEIIIVKYLNNCKLNDIMELYNFKSRTSIYQYIEKFNKPQYLRKTHISEEDVLLLNRILTIGRKITRTCI